MKRTLLLVGVFCLGFFGGREWERRPLIFDEIVLSGKMSQGYHHAGRLDEHREWRCVARPAKDGHTNLWCLPDSDWTESDVAPVYRHDLKLIELESRVQSCKETTDALIDLALAHDVPIEAINHAIMAGATEHYIPGLIIEAHIPTKETR